MRDGFDTHIPRLVVDPGGAVRTYIPRGVFDLIREGGRHEHLREQGVWIQGDRADQVVQLVGREALEFVRVFTGRHAALGEYGERAASGEASGDERKRGDKGERSMFHGPAPE